MKSITTLNVTVFILVVFLSTACSSKKVENKLDVTVEIDYGQGKNPRKINVTGNSDLTALKALQYVANVETQPREGYVFVTAIDNVNGKRGEMGWYYKINNQPAKKLAIDNKLKNGDIITWTYKEDVCSEKVDK